MFHTTGETCTICAGFPYDWGNLYDLYRFSIRVGKPVRSVQIFRMNGETCTTCADFPYDWGNLYDLCRFFVRLGKPVRHAQVFRMTGETCTICAGFSYDWGNLCDLCRFFIWLGKPLRSVQIFRIGGKTCTICADFSIQYDDRYEEGSASGSEVWGPGNTRPPRPPRSQHSSAAPTLVRDSFRTLVRHKKARAQKNTKTEIACYKWNATYIYLQLN